MTINRFKEQQAFFVTRLIEWAQKNYRYFPWRVKNIGVYESLIVELMLRRTTAKQVEAVYEDFIKAFPTPILLEKASIEQLELILKPLGLKSQRAVALKDVASILVHQGIPTSLEEIEKIPHVGTYISKAVGCFSLGLRLPIIDSNVIRIFSRFFGLPAMPDNRRNKELQILTSEILPDNEYITYNYGLLDFGASVCIRKPRCHHCELSQFCNTVPELHN